LIGTVEAAENLALEPLDGDSWRTFVESSEGSCPFHHPAWAALMTESHGYQGFAVTVVEGGEIVAGLPVLAVSRGRWLALPFADYCPPLARDEASFATLVSGLNDLRKENGVGEVEVRAELRGADVHPVRFSLRHALALQPDPEALRSTFNQSRVRRGIGQAERAGVVVRRGESSADLADVFYRLHLKTRRRLGKPVQKREFFELLWKRILEPGLGFVLIAYAGSTPAAGAVYLSSYGATTYLYGASDPDQTKVRPNHMVMWKAIEWSCRLGDRTFDFGRTDPDNQGLRDFKNGWGTVEEPLVYTALADHPPSPSSGRLRTVAEGVIRRAPPPASRLLGELLHRYTA
jgi:CelD/BcsL family acetyltransferase involved in cellulose biosynthesis